MDGRGVTSIEIGNAMEERQQETTRSSSNRKQERGTPNNIRRSRKTNSMRPKTTPSRILRCRHLRSTPSSPVHALISGPRPHLQIQSRRRRSRKTNSMRSTTTPWRVLRCRHLRSVPSSPNPIVSTTTSIGRSGEVHQP